MYDQFKMKAEAVGAEVQRFATEEEALDFVLQFLQKEGLADENGCYAVWADSPFARRFHGNRLDKVAGLRCEVKRALATQAKFGITEVDWALADTGSLVQDQSAVEQRLASSLPEIHIAIAPTANILPSKTALFSRINPNTSRYIAFITGPSRTADIERVLTIGVHGPQRLVIVFVDELGGDK